MYQANQSLSPLCLTYNNLQDINFDLYSCQAVLDLSPSSHFHDGKRDPELKIMT